MILRYSSGSIPTPLLVTGGPRLHARATDIDDQSFHAIVVAPCSANISKARRPLRTLL